MSHTKPSGIGPDDEYRELTPLCVSTFDLGRVEYHWRPRTAHMRVQEMRFGTIFSGPLRPQRMAAELMKEKLETQQRLLRYLSNAERSEYRKLRAIELREQSQTPRTYSQNRRFRQAIADL
ncbi:hypothetical protein J0X15_15815 [Roseibium sp. CAU 1637]|uniref:Uncharacterized protein n=1 Tax=Roseibium limicola TaxID=2816037 RepID=A0A939EQX0_9HYPH|nr:hypothetical protein [Roseibium limicola]MBO0346695.1 hypothetical protein [Roseibium limicola]